MSAICPLSGGKRTWRQRSELAVTPYSITFHSANLWSGILRTENWIIQTRIRPSCKRAFNFRHLHDQLPLVLYMSRLILAGP